MKHHNFTLSAVLLSSILAPLTVLPTASMAATEDKAAHPFRLSPDIKLNSMEVLKSQTASTQKTPQVKKPAGPTTTAKVIEVLASNDYSYLQVEANNTKTWIAGIKIKAKAGDTIHYVESVTMNNFLSKSLNRTFDKLVFVSNVSYE